MTHSLNRDIAQPMIKPLEIPSPLAGNPGQDPRYAVEIKRLTGQALKVADPQATRAMVALMDMQAQLSGAASHWGGPAAFAELMAATHALMFDEGQRSDRPWSEMFHFVNDAGHCENGLYALKANYGYAGLDLSALKQFRSIESSLTGHGESHLFPQGVYISNGPLGSGLPQAQGLAVADRLAGRSRVTICAISDGGCMEGEAREALAAIPGLAHRGLLAPFVMIISDNNTKLSGRIDQDSYSMAPTFAGLKDLGWNVIHLADGHHLEGCLLVIEEAIQKVRENPRMPLAIHARTQKGFGFEKAVKSASGGHGFPLKEAKELRAMLKEIYHGGEVPKEFLAWCSDLENGVGLPKSAKPEAVRPESPVHGLERGPKGKVQEGVARALIAAREKGLPVVSVTSDLPGSTGVAAFQKKFPDCAIDVGVAEANMISVAIGLSKEGFIPVVDTFSQFGVTKGNLPLLMSALSQGPVIAIFSHAGFQDAADGASHQALSYLAATCAIPHTDSHVLTSSEEAEALVTEAVESFVSDRESGRVPRSQLFFLGRENFARGFGTEGQRYNLGHAQEVLIQDGAQALIVAAGPCLPEALMAAELLSKEGLAVNVVNPSIVNMPDVTTLGPLLEKSMGRLLTVEDHQVMGGMGALLVHALVESGAQIQKLRSLGVRDEFGRSAYTAADLYRRHGLDAAGIQEAVRSLVQS